MARRTMAAPLALLLFLALPAALAVPQAAAAAAGPKLLVTTKTGKLQGFVEQGSRKWLGVPVRAASALLPAPSAYRASWSSTCTPVPGCTQESRWQHFPTGQFSPSMHPKR